MKKKKIEKSITIVPQESKKVKVKPDKQPIKVKVEPEMIPVEIIKPPTKEIKNVAVIGFDKYCNLFIKNHLKDACKIYYKITKLDDINNEITYDYYIKTHKLHELKEYGFIMNIFKQKIKENGRY